MFDNTLIRLCDYDLQICFFYSTGGLFTFFVVSFESQKFLTLKKSNVSNFSFSTYIFSVTSKMS